MLIRRSTPQDSKTERQILIAMIISDAVCMMINSLYQKHYFQTKMTQEVSDWCMNFYEKYDSAPKQDIQTIFENKTKSGRIDPDLGEEIEVFLTSISTEYELDGKEFNSKYYIDLTRSYFKKRSYVQFASKIKEAAENDDVEEAEKVYTSFIKVQEQQDTSRNILSEEGILAFQQSMETRPKYLFTMPGALGKMIGPIERETFIGLLGREKIGKTFVLQVFAKAAAKSGLKVAFIQTGDLSHDQLDTRLFNDLVNGTSKEENVGEYLAPVMDCSKNQMGVCDKHPSETIVTKGKENLIFTVDVTDPDVIAGHQPCVECYTNLEKRDKFKGSIWWKPKTTQQWSWGQLKKKIRLFKKWFKGDIITEAFSMQTMKMSDIRSWLLVKQKQTGWLPDLLLIDYPDIMKAEKEGEFRHGENEKWMLGRRISQDFHCCVIFVTQADATAFGKDTLNLKNFSEDKRKYAHCTHFYAINKTESEERCGVFRLGALLLRENNAKITQQVSVLQDLKISRPYVCSFFGKCPDLGPSSNN